MIFSNAESAVFSSVLYVRSKMLTTCGYFVSVVVFPMEAIFDLALDFDANCVCSVEETDFSMTVWKSHIAAC